MHTIMETLMRVLRLGYSRSRHYINPNTKARVITNTPGQLKGDTMRQINAGVGSFIILDRAAKRGTNFIVRIRKPDLEELADYVAKGFFPIPYFGRTAYIKLEGVSPDKTWEALGLKATFGPKAPKRGQELINFRRIAIVQEGKGYDIAVIEGDEILYDGVSFVRKSAVVEAIGQIPDKGVRARLLRDIRERNITSGSGRLITYWGFIKGDFIIVEDSQMNASFGRKVSFVTHEVNVKQELVTIPQDGKDWTVFTFEPHRGTKGAKMDALTGIWLGPWLLPPKAAIASVQSAVDTAVEALKNGEYPKWMQWRGEDVQDVNDMFKRAQAFGLPLQAFSPFTHIAGNGLLMRLNRHRDGDMWIPIPCSGQAHITSTESMQNMGGFDMRPYGANVAYVHHRLIMPGRQFEEFKDRFGGGDYDDLVVFAAINGFDSSKGEKVADARPMLVLWRRPNSWGEYAIVENVDWDSIDPVLEFRWMDKYPVRDLARRPAFYEERRAQQKIRHWGETNIVYGGDFTVEKAIALAESLAEAETSVGAVANATAAYYSRFGTPPPSELECMGDIIDVIQQSPDGDRLNLIAKYVTWLNNEVENSGGMMDEVIWRTRTNRRIREKVNPDPNGYWATIHRGYIEVTKDYAEAIDKLALELRKEYDLLPDLGKAETPEDVWDRGVRMIEWANLRFTEIGKKYRQDVARVRASAAADPESNSRFLLPALAQTRAEECREVVRMAVARLNKWEDAVDVVQAAYLYCVKGDSTICVRTARDEDGSVRPVIYQADDGRFKPNRQNGAADQLLTRAAGDGEVAVFDFLIEALLKAKVAKLPVYIDGTVIQVDLSDEGLTTDASPAQMMLEVIQEFLNEAPSESNPEMAEALELFMLGYRRNEES